MDNLIKNPDKEKLRLLFGEIINGRSMLKVPDLGELYLKHYDHFDTAMVDREGEKHYSYAKKKGLPTEKAQLEMLDEKEIWTKEDEEEFIEIKKRISQLHDSKEKLVIAKEIKPIDVEIAQRSVEYGTKGVDRKTKIGMCCETYRSKKENEEFLFHSLYKSEELKEKYYTRSEFDELDEDILKKIIFIYEKNQLNFNDLNLKRIALSNFFLNFFYLCEDNTYSFWGKPIIKLTFYQAALFTHARSFKNTLSQSKHKPTTEAFQNPDDLLKWMSSANNAEEMMEKLDEKGKEKEGKQKVAGATTLVGASKNDFAFLGIDNETQGVSLAKEAEKKGGTLNMQDMLKIHGIS